ncbi:alpha/beta hydrolase [Aquisalimonas asiatica]|uniref:Alpha/beta hydrolase family protein n=1 Tax=Aquisalimonas asiatica TaxID=406100 RepID=A0A1H8VU99_9GAMM|nr:alpha/beta hydrolase [Aquisalimonas asiatica]SEP18863.1 Alpha/beta hydrolase of unknown function [Aquisalimonas asiatica]
MVRPQETRQLRFRARRAEDGDVATVSVYCVDGNGDRRGDPITEKEVELRSGQTDYVAEVTLPDGGGGCSRGGGQAAGLRFGLRVQGTRNRTPSPLARVMQPLRLRLETSPETDWQPDWAGARVLLRDREADVTFEATADAAGEVAFPELTFGGEMEISVALPSESAVRDTAATDAPWVDAAIYGVVGDDVEGDVRVLPGTPVVFRIDGPLSEPLKVRCLPPPVMVDLRLDPEDAPDPAYRLSDQELRYFQAQGNAVIFVHGYNVGHGGLPKRINELDRDYRLDERISVHRSHWSAVVDDDVARPIAYDHSVLADRFPAFRRAIDYPQMVNIEPNMDPNELLNGEGAWGWLLCMEYNLNRAAGLGGENDDDWPWERYTRCIGVTWTGDNGTRNFKESQTAAVVAGRRLVPLLRQLHDAGVAVTLMGHSLGARVVLSALHVHADTDDPRRVVDTALSPAPDNECDDPDDPSPLGTAVFPRAHRAAERFLVLHSNGDNVLGGEAPVPGSGSLREGVLGMLGGVYPKHRWRMSMNSEFRRLLEPYLGSHYTMPAPMSRDRWADYQRRIDDYARRPEVRAAWSRFRNAVMDEARNASAPTPGLLPEYHLLSPVALDERITEARAKAYCDALHALWRDRFHVNHPPRSAMGYGGFADDRGGLDDLDLIDAQLDDFDQKDVLHQHSGMRVPEGLMGFERNDETLFAKVFQEEIWNSRLSKYTGFGAW